MIQKLIGNTLYVLKKDAYKITRDVTDASIIFVNCNTIDDFRLLNPELELTPFNYLLLRKTDPEYWPYVDMKDDAEFYFDQGIQNVSSYVDQNYSGVRQEPVYPSDLDVSLLFYFDDVLMDSSSYTLSDAGQYKISAEIKDSSKYDDETQEYLIIYEKVKRDCTLSFNTTSYEVSTYADENYSGQIQQVSGIPVGQTVNYYLGNSLLSGDSITLTEPGFYVVSARLEDSSIYNDTSTSYTISYQKQKRTATLSFANSVVDVSVEDVTTYSGNVQEVSGAPQGVNINYYLGNTLLTNGQISIDNLQEGENTFIITAKIENDSVYNDTSASYELNITMEISSYENKYLTFEALEDGTFKFAYKNVSYSVDNGSTWIELAADTSTETIHRGEKILWKGTNNNYQTLNGQITASGNFNVEGNIMSLIYGDNFTNQYRLSEDNVFKDLFSNNVKLISAENLILPATTLCTKCYQSMFSNCQNLTIAPELPATTLAQQCYSSMFRTCTSLTNAPELPATTLKTSCYEYMFFGCRSLNYIKAACPPNLETGKYYWVNQVSGTGTYIISDSNYDPNNGVIYSIHSVPPGWTVRTLNGKIVANISFTDSVVNVSTYAGENYTGTIQSLNGVPSGVTPKYYLDSSLLSSNNITLTTSGNHTVVGTIENEVNYNDVSKSYTINYTQVTRTVQGNINLNGYDYDENADAVLFYLGDSSVILPKIGTVTDAYNDEQIIDMTGKDASVNYELLSDQDGTPGTSDATYAYLYNPDYPEPEDATVSEQDSLYDDQKLCFKAVGSGWINMEMYSYSDDFEWVGTSYKFKILPGNRPINYSSKYFTIEPLENGSVKFSDTTNNLSYSTDDGETWSTLNYDTSLNVTTGNNVIFKCSNPTVVRDAINGGMGIFNSSGQINVSGNIMSLVYGDDFADDTQQNYNVLPDCAFAKLFYHNTNVVNANNLILPAEQMTYYCYSRMFSGCTSLLTTPELPSLNLANSCYLSMFNNCSSLTKGPELPADNVSYSQCYYMLFSGCSNLSEIKLHATECTTVSSTFGKWVQDVSTSGVLYWHEDYLNFSLDENSINGIPIFWSTFNLDFEGLTVYYNITDTNNEVQIFSAGGGSSESGASESPDGGGAMPLNMYVDGIEESPASTWRFSTPGEHVIYYTFDSDVIPAGFLAGNYLVTKVRIGNDFTVISDTTGSTSDGCFASCSHLVNVIMGENINAIGVGAFCDDISLQNITLLATTPPSVGSDAFEHTNNCPIYVPAEAFSDYLEASAWHLYSDRLFTIDE